MLRIQRMISLNEDVSKDLKKRTRQDNFCFSAWINRTYRHKFMSINGREEEIKEYIKKIEQLKHEILEHKDIIDTFRYNLTRDEIRFIRTIPSLIRDGRRLPFILTRFNTSFDNDFVLSELKELMHKYKEQ